VLEQVQEIIHEKLVVPAINVSASRLAAFVDVFNAEAVAVFGGVSTNDDRMRFFINPPDGFDEQHLALPDILPRDAFDGLPVFPGLKRLKPRDTINLIKLVDFVFSHAGLRFRRRAARGERDYADNERIVNN
jgi:hypothetical protein